MQVNANSVAGALLSGDMSPLQQPGGSFLPFIRDILGGSLFKRIGEVQAGEFVGNGITTAIITTLDFDTTILFILDPTAPIINVILKTAGGTNHYSIAAAGGITLVGAQGVVFGATGSKTFGVGTDTKANVNARTYQFLAIGA